jgi:hypothetical protein
MIEHGLNIPIARPAESPSTLEQFSRPPCTDASDAAVNSEGLAAAAVCELTTVSNNKHAAMAMGGTRFFTFVMHTSGFWRLTPPVGLTSGRTRAPLP